MLDEDPYPTDAELDFLTHYDTLYGDVQEFLADLERCWHWPDRGFKVTGKRVLRLQLHTGGWSGNESIIGALDGNRLFWWMCWQKSIRGGHFWFRIDLRNHFLNKPEKRKHERAGTVRTT